MSISEAKPNWEARALSQAFAEKRWEDFIRTTPTLAERIAALEKAVAALQCKPRTEPPEWPNIISAVSLTFGIQEDQLLGKDKHREFVEARQLCAWLMSKTTRMSTTRIGTVMGFTRHNTSHAVKATENRRETDPKFKAMADALLARFNGSKCA